MSQQYYTLVTNIGAARIAKATALGTVVNLSQMAVGDGGGKPITPSATATALTREVYRASLNMLEVDENNQKQVIAELLIPEEEGDFTIREVGLFDNNNNLIAIGSIADSYKPRLSSGSASQQIIRMVIQIDNTDAVGLKVDPAVVLATREYVEKLINKKFKDNGFGGAAQIVLSFDSRREFIAALENLTKLKDGAVIIAQGHLYKKQTGARYIPDAPDWLPIDESFAHFDGDYIDTREKTIVRCRYHQKNGKKWNITEVINPKPGSIRKILLGEPDAQKKIKLEKLHDYVGNSRARILLSCDGWTTPPVDGKAALQGLQIVDGKVHRDWASSDYDTNAAAVWMRNGKLKAAKSKDGKSAAQWVDEGAEWSASFARGPVLVENGSVIQNPDTYLSARAAIGQRADRSIVLLNLEGISGSYGATLQESAQIMADEGCLIAVALDAGGSSQVWYGDAYACPSSDDGFQTGRAIPSAIEIIADVVEPYDTGWIPLPVIDGVKAGSKGQGGAAIAYRQRGGDIELRLDTVYSFKANIETIITTEEIPKRFRNQDYRPLRAIACGFGGAVVPWWSGTYISIQPHKDTPYTYGYTEWHTPNSK
ncbi:phage tail-collar fiber domain-containing protein [Neisseria sp. P0022.S007]|uniref:phage tail-collar fiber domain-containing protein n=1 Tax=unclassified Neisseria TaxID=2623750 RepID=UPI003F7E8DA0